MKTSITLITLILLFACKNQESKRTEFTERKDVGIEKPQTQSIYELIVNKTESSDSLRNKRFDFSKNHTEKEVKALNLDTTKMGLNEHYFLSDEVFLKKSLDSMSFLIFYRHKYGDQLEKLLRIQSRDTIFVLALAVYAGDSDTYSLSTQFLNDSIFHQTMLYESTIVDDTYLNASEIDSITKTFSYNQKLDFQQIKTDSVKIKNTGFVGYPIEEIGSNSQLVYKDSLDLLLFWRKTAFSMMDTINSHLSNSKIESLLYDYYDGKGGLNAGGVYSSPDGLFKILVVGGESCGAYCNPFWESELILSNGKRINNLSFRNIENIHSMPDGKYLILEESFGRPASVFTETTKSATLVSFKEGEINYHPFNFSYPKYDEIQNNKNYNPSGKLSFSQEHFIDAEQYLTYNKETKRLKYSYGTDFSYCCQIDSTYVFKGVFEYKNGGFTLLNEKKEYIKVE